VAACPSRDPVRTGYGLSVSLASDHDSIPDAVHRPAAQNKNAEQSRQLVENKGGPLWQGKLAPTVSGSRLSCVISSWPELVQEQRDGNGHAAKDEEY